MPALLEKANRRSTAADPVSESHTVGESRSGWVKLLEVPSAAADVLIPGYTEVVGTPLVGEFRVVYNGRGMGWLQFDPSEDGTSIVVTYSPTGSAVDADDVNQVQDWIGMLTPPIQQHGLAGDGVTSEAAALAALEPGHYIVSPGTYLIDANTTIPAGVSLKVDRGAIFTVLSGITFTPNGAIDESSAGNYQIIDIGDGATPVDAVVAGMRFVNVKWFGAVGDGATSTDSFFLTAAANSLATDGSRLYFPAGNYLAGASGDNRVIHLPSNCEVYGEGAHTSVIRQNGTWPVTMVADGASNLHVHDLGFDVNARVDFPTSLKVIDGYNVTVERCWFYNPNKAEAAADGWTVHALDFKNNARRIRIQNNEFEHTQCKINTAGNESTTTRKIEDVWIENNHMYQPNRHAISCLTSGANSITRNITIRGNKCWEADAQFFHLGNDSKDNATTGFLAHGNIAENWLVEGNILYGNMLAVQAGTASGGYIQFRLGMSNRNIVFRNNQILPTSSHGATQGIVLQAQTDMTTVEGFVVADNLIQDMAQYAVRLRSDVVALIEGNQFVRSRGVLVLGGCEVLLRDNLIDGGGVNKYAVEATDPTTLRVIGNEMRDFSHGVATDGAVKLTINSGVNSVVEYRSNYIHDTQAMPTTEAAFETVLTGTWEAIIVDNRARGIQRFTSGFRPETDCIAFRENDGGATGTSYAASFKTDRTQLVKTSVNFNLPSLAAGAQAAVATLSVPGAALGDIVSVALSADLLGTRLWGEVTAADTVTIYHFNGTSAAQDVNASTLTVVVTRVNTA